MADMINLIDDLTPETSDDEKRLASLTLADRATSTDELLDWLDMFGLPPCERDIRRSKKNRKGKR